MNRNCREHGHDVAWCTTPEECNAPSGVRLNAERDPNYRPYCLRCHGLVRMEKVATMFWRCAVCGAEHKEEVPHDSVTGKAGQAEDNWCLQCEGTGHGPCANCGDLSVVECACDDPSETECDVCEGTGKVEKE